MPFYLPGIDKINSFQFTLNEEVDLQSRLLSEYSKIGQNLNVMSPEDLKEVEIYLNSLEKVQSVFKEPIQDLDKEEKISTNNIEERINIPDVKFQYHRNLHQPIEDGSNIDNEDEFINPFYRTNDRPEKKGFEETENKRERSSQIVRQKFEESDEIIVV